MPPLTTPQTSDLPAERHLGLDGRAADGRRRGDAFWATACATTDAAMLAVAPSLAWVAAGTAGRPPFGWLVALPVLAMLLLGLRGSYALTPRPRLLGDLYVVISVTAVAAMAVIFARVALGDEADVVSQTMWQWAFAAALLGAGRVGLNGAWVRASRRGQAGRRTLIVGAGEVGHLTAKRLLGEPELGMQPVGFLDGQPLSVNGNSAELPVLGASEDLERIVSEREVQHVIVTFSTEPHDVLLGIVRRCWELGVTVSLVPRLFEVQGERATVEHLGGLPLVTVSSADPRGWQFTVKYALDRVIAATALLLALPLLVPVALAVRLTLGSPVLFRQRRIGLDGDEFHILKFRTMRRAKPGELAKAPAAGEDDIGPGGVEGVDRRTRLGALLRRSSIDELPQLINVLRGEMSIVGPRPERPEFANAFSEAIYRYADRHRVKSGITGWAQVHGLNGKTSIADRAEWDNFYIENWSLWLDFKIFLRTPAAILRGHDES